MAFHAVGLEAAARIDEWYFGRSFAGSSATPASDPAVARHVIRYLSRFRALLRSRHGEKLALSSVPLVTTNKRGRMAPVDLRLQRTSTGFTPANPLQRLMISSRLAGGLAIGQDGFRLVPVGANVQARLRDRQRVMYHDVATDTDMLAMPTSRGAELSAVLRSRRSPEILSFRAGLPRGAVLRTDGRGGAAVIRGGKRLVTILPPAAVDAQGTAVRVAMTVVGRRLVLHVDHRDRDLAYPLLVDPQVVIREPFNPMGFGTWLGDIAPPTDPYVTSGPQALYAPPGRYQESPDSWVSWLWRPPALSLRVHTPVTYTWSVQGLTAVNAEGPGVWVIFDTNLAGCLGAAGISVEEKDLQSVMSQDITAGPATEYAAECINQHPDEWTDLFEQVATIGPNPNPTTVSLANTSYLTYNSVLLTMDVTPASPRSDWLGPSNPAQPSQQRVSCGDPVNCATGNRFETKTDLAFPGRGGGIALTRTYNSQAAAKQDGPGPFGYGWSSSYSAHVSIDSDTGTATVTQDNGSTASFADTGSAYTPINPLTQATLEKKADGSYIYTLPDRSVLSFDADGRLESQADRAGNSTHLTYDGQGRLQTIDDGSGRSITLSYNTDGTVARASDSAGRHVTYTYTDGDLTSVADAGGAEWEYGYDSSHELTTDTDPLRHEVRTVYDDAHRVTSQTDAMNRTTAWSYSSWSAGSSYGTDTEVTDPLGHTTAYRFDDAFDLLRVRRSDGGEYSYQYDDAGDVTSVESPGGFRTNYDYDADGNLIARTDPNGHTKRWSYDGQHDVISQTLPSGLKTSYSYTASGSLATVRRESADGATSQTWTFAHTDTSHPGDITSITDPFGRETSLTYDSAGDLASVTTPAGETTTYAYDSAGNRTAMVSGRGNANGADPSQYRTTYSYDAYGDLLSETDPRGHTTEWEYDADRNLTSITDAAGRKTTYSYDAANEATSTTQPDGTRITTSYDEDGHIVERTNGAGQTTTYEYNALGQRVGVTDPLHRKTTYGYDAAGHVASATDPAGKTTTYTYDGAGQLTGVLFSDSTPSSFLDYDADGRLTSATGGVNMTYTYDALGRLASSTDGSAPGGSDSGRIAHGYDVASELTFITYPNAKRFRAPTTTTAASRV